MKDIFYFAYGSNMSVARLKARLPEVVPIGRCTLEKHDLRFHKISQDGSAKCDAFFTNDPRDIVYGILFKIDSAQKALLDEFEGAGNGYDIKEVTVTQADGSSINAMTYVATIFGNSLKPYTWYKDHVRVGAEEGKLPADYIRTKILSINAVEDQDRKRNDHELSIYR